MTDDARRDTCEACERDDALDPHVNPTGQSTISYRIAEHGRFLARMRARISRQAVPPNDPTATRHPLATLTTRAEDEPLLALMDAWACTLDVLSFYQERIANEGFVRTAQERRSVLELARAIGYELRPGVAANTRLAFTLLDTNKSPQQVTLSSGLQVLSVPGPGEQPQTFETVESVLARPQWNAMRPVQRERPPLQRGDQVLYLDGLDTGLRRGDKLLVVGTERESEPESNVWDFRTVMVVAPDAKAKVTRVELDAGLGWSGFGGTRTIDPPEQPAVFAFGERLAVFGRSAPDPRLFSAEMQQSLSALLTSDKTEWANFRVTTSEGGVRVHVVGAAKELLPGSWLVFEDEGYTELYRAKVVEASGRKDFGLTLETTRVTLDTNVNLERFEPRSVTVHGLSRELTLGTQAIDSALEPRELRLEGLLPLLEPGRAVIVSGPAHDAAPELERDDPELEFLGEVAIVERMDHAADHTRLVLEAPLAHVYDRRRSLIFGNVARATHGKTTTEVIGSGDGSKRFQSFSLRQRPLTHVSTREGTSSTLTVRVRGVAWSAVNSTLGLGPDARVYVPRTDDDGVTTLTFGDGVNGARLPTGAENVSAAYRVGIGRDGAVKAGALSILKTRPQGVKAVNNPLPASGAEDPEQLDEARSNAPTTVLTLDRIVSVSDYEDYAQAYPGIGKAQSVALWDGRRSWVHLTLATSEALPVLPTDDLYQSLMADLDRRRDPAQQLLLGTFVPRTFKLRARLALDPAHLPELVFDAVEHALRCAFSFEARRFGQPVTGAEILALVQGIEGVIAIDLDALWRTDEHPPSGASSPSSWTLPAWPTRWDGASGGVLPSELLLIDDAPDAVALEASL